MKTIAKIVFLLLLASCTKEQTTVLLSIDYVYYRPYSGELPITGVMTTDKGVFEFELINETGGGSSNSIEVEPGIYKVLDVTLYDVEGNETHYVMERPSNDGKGMQPTSWVGESHDIDQDMVLLWNVIAFY